MKKNTYNAIRFHKAGSKDVLQYDTLSMPRPTGNEVLIKVNAIGINRAEVMFREAQYIEQPVFPSTLGYEAAGTIEDIGERVSHYKIGDMVNTIPAFSMGQYGVYGEYALVPEAAIIAQPPQFNHIQGAAIWMSYITAYGALVTYGKLTHGQSIIITAASSSVGVAAIQLAKALGATVIATSRDTSKHAFLLAQGADHVIATNEQNLVDEVNKVTHNKGANLIFDPVGGPLLAQLADACAPKAVIIEYGALDSHATPYPLFTALAKGLVIKGYTLFEITKHEERLRQATDKLMPLFTSGKLCPVIDKMFDFEQIHAAHAYMESNKQQGKIVVSLAQ